MSAKNILVGSQKTEAEKIYKTMTKFKFEKLIIWQKAMDYGESIIRLSYKFPKEETYNLSSLVIR